MSQNIENTLTLTTGSLEAYIRSVGSNPVLDADEERRLARIYLKENNLDAARKLIVSNLRFVVHIARGYAGYGLPQADLVQEGNVGLMKAVKRFNPEMNVRLVSYAVHWIRAEIHEYILRNWRIVKVATTKAQRKLFFNLRSAKKSLNWLAKDEVEAVAKDLGVRPVDVREMESRLSSHDASFDPCMDRDHDDERAYTPAAYLQDMRMDPTTQVEEQDWQSNNATRLHQAIGDLDERSQEILKERWMTEDKTTLQELATRYQVSAERIRQIEKNAMNKIKMTLDA